jgi:glycosyltransferase involved in cell wall biosynthesis
MAAFGTSATAVPGVGRGALRVAMIAPPWISVPPAGYGGIEAVVSLLCDELVARGHDVVLLAAPGSRSAASVRSPLESEHPDRIGWALYEANHVGVAYDAIEEAARNGRSFDVVHDHSGFTAVAMAPRSPAPVVHTLHSPFNEDTTPFYVRHGHKVTLVAISRYQQEHAPPGVRITEMVPNPIRVEDWPFCEQKEPYLLWVGRFDPVKGADRAITVARRAGLRLVLAGPVQPGQEPYFHREIEPHIDGEMVRYVGEIGGAARKQLFAHAKAFLMPIRWAEPFGLVMIEALVCGTPVLAFPEGAVGEIVIDGENGFQVSDEQRMVDAISRLDQIDPLRCRESVASRYDAPIIAERYEAVYHRAIGTAASHLRRLRTREQSPRTSAASPIRRELHPPSTPAPASHPHGNPRSVPARE